MSPIEERATEFVNKYPNLFTEDKEFWINTIHDLLLDEQGHSRKLLYNTADMEEAFRAGGSTNGEGLEKFMKTYE